MNRPIFLALFAIVSGGCARSDLGERAASEVVKSAVKEEAGKIKSREPKIGEARMEGEGGSKLIGADAKGNKLWELSAKVIVTKEPGKAGLPSRATLTGATIKLYRENKLESTFGAPLVEFFNGETGLRLAMTRGVRASNVGALGKDGVPIAVSAPRGDIDINKRLVNLSGGARAVRGDITATGQTLATQTDLARSTFTGDVVATSPRGKTNAKDAVFAWKANALAANGVTFTRPGLVLTGAKLAADTAAERGTLSGDVRAVTPDSRASAPAVDFDWKADSIRAAKATISRAGANMETGALQTDSQLEIANARDVTIRKDNAVLRAQSARGFDGLTRLTGERVVVVRAGTTLTAARAKADNWSEQAGVITGSGGVTARSEQGQLSAPDAIWSGGQNGRIVASGGVTIVSDGTTIKGARGESDPQFNAVTLSGNVRATTKDGSILNAPKVVKTGDQIVASGGTTAQMKTPGTLGLLTMKAPRIETTVGGQTARASGGVNIKSASGASASAPTATYNSATRKVVASGGVVYKDPARGDVTAQSLKADLRLQKAEFVGIQGQSDKDPFDGKGLFGRK